MYQAKLRKHAIPNGPQTARFFINLNGTSGCGARSSHSTNAGTDRRVNIAASLVYVLITWGIALFGLIPLVAKGYGYLGALSLPLLVLPVILIGLLRSGGWRKER